MRPPLGYGLNRMPTWFAATTFVAAFVLASTAWTQVPTTSKETKITRPVTNISLLDGRQFKAGIVKVDAEQDGKKPPLGDQLMFSDGMFSSAVCKRYNFTAAPYWVRVEGDRVHFLAELTSPTDGRMLWKGSIRGDTLEGTMRWTKKRWYWTIDTEHKITGKLEKVLSAVLPNRN